MTMQFSVPYSVLSLFLIFQKFKAGSQNTIVVWCFCMVSPTFSISKCTLANKCILANKQRQIIQRKSEITDCYLDTNYPMNNGSDLH